MIAAAALIATGSLSVAALLAGASGPAPAPVPPAAPAAVAAAIRTAPLVVAPAVAPASRRAVVAPAAAPVRRTVAAPVVRHVPAAAPVRKPVATVPPRPAAPKPVEAPAPAPSPSVRDDYPFRTATTNDSDTWGFTKRQCVSFVAFRLAQRGQAIDNRTQNWGSALTWDEAAQRLGKAVTTRPTVGAIAQWNAGESSAVYSSTGTRRGTFTAGEYGHVGYVVAVYGDGTVLVEQYNLAGDRNYSAMRMSAPRYIAF